jgi:aminobenzoyl-glutamate utilization protein B
MASLAIRFLLLLLFFTLTPAAHAQYEAINASIRERGDASWAMAQKIWNWAESGYQEKKSAELISNALEAAGFKIQRGVAQMPTAFTATIGSGKPVIGILGEYDALPGLAQETTPVRQPRPGINGHGCGHHLFGVASASACIALAEQFKKGTLKGTLRYYGCPAEEGGGAKAFMVRDGLFQDVDTVLHWHPGSANLTGDVSCLARIGVKFRFHGRSSHAAGAPEKGNSALDAVELTNHASELLREHTPDFTRIHHVITAGGGAPNVVPDFAEVYFYVRHPSSETANKVYARLLKCAQAGALATDTRLETIYLGGTLELLPNQTLGRIAGKHLRAQNDLKYSDAEKAFALRLQETFEDRPPLEKIRDVSDRSGTVGMGSTDVGDVSWVVPTTGFYTACFVPGTPGHSWQAVASGGTTIGRQGMQLAARVLADTACELFQNPKLIAQAWAEHKDRRAGRPYKPLLEPGQKPPLDYRTPPKPKGAE